MDAVTQRHGDAMRELAEHRAYRLSGYAKPVVCMATNAQIRQIEKELWGDDKDYEMGMIETVIARMIAYHCV